MGCLRGAVYRVADALMEQEGAAMVEMEDTMQTQNVIQNLNGVPLFGRELSISFSKHERILDSSSKASHHALISCHCIDKSH